MNETQETPAVASSKLKLGQGVAYTGYYHRMSLRDKRWWQASSCPEQKGIIVGSRTLWDGEVYTEYVDNGDDEKGYSSTFTQHSHKPAYLVAFAMNRKPVLVPIDLITAA